MTEKKSYIPALGLILATIIGVAIIISISFVFGFHTGYRQSLMSEFTYEQKYKGVIQALISEAKWARVNIESIQKLESQGSSQQRSSSSSTR